MKGDADLRAIEGDADHNGHSGVTMGELDTFLNGDEPSVEAVEPQAEPQATPEPESADNAPTGPERDENGRFKAKGETDDAPPASDRKEKGLEAAAAAERKKRQEWETKYAELEKRIAQFENPPKPVEPPPPPPSIWEDEQGYGQHVVSTAVQQASMNARLDMSEMMVRQAHTDFDEIKAEFLRMAEMNPAIAQEALNDPHPWNRAYQIASNARTMKELGAVNLDELKAQLREQLKAEQAAANPAPQLPQSLAGEQTSRGNATAPAAFNFEDLFPRR